jgi:transcriptional regulator with GAF, ATPase, and Fis domain
MISLLLITNDINEAKFVTDFCDKKGFIFFFLKDKEQIRAFLLNENITVSIVNSSIINEPEDFIMDLRENNCNTSLIYIGEESFSKARKLLKMGYYDYLTFDYEKEALFASVDEAVENIFAFEKIKGLAEELEKTNKELIEKTKELENQKKFLQLHLEMMESINVFSKKINLEKTLKGIQNLVMEYLREMFRDRIILFTSIDKYQEKIVDSRGISLKSLKNYKWNLKDLKSAPWANYILDNKQVVRIKYPLKDTWYSKSDIVNIFPYGFIKIPLYTSKKVYGTIMISIDSKHMEFSSEDEIFITFIAEHTSISIENIKLKETLEETQNKIIEQEKIATMTKLAVSINHEINNPLCAISLNVEMLKRRLNDNSYADIIDTIESNIEKIMNVTNKINKLNKINTKEYIPGIDMIDLEN